MILGQFSASIYFKVSSITIMVTVFVIYWISQYYQHEKPFSACWISDVANHYPQYIFFRTATISGSVLLFLGWMTNYFYLRTVITQKKIPVNKYSPQVMTFVGILGSVALMGSTANLDVTKLSQDWHSHCAVLFFLSTMFAQIYNTVIYAIIWFKFKAVSRILAYSKLVLTSFLILQLIYLYTNNSFNHYGKPVDQNNIQSIKAVILQYTATYTIFAGFWLMSLDVAKFRYVYEHSDKKQIHLYQNSNSTHSVQLQSQS